jgi:hypothetical protein
MHTKRHPSHVLLKEKSSFKKALELGKILFTKQLIYLFYMHVYPIITKAAFSSVTSKVALIVRPILP